MISRPATIAPFNAPIALPASTRVDLHSIGSPSLLVLIALHRAGLSKPGVDREQKNDVTHELRPPNAIAASRRASGTTVLERYDPRAEQFHTGATVHLSSQRLQPIDVALDGPIAPVFGHGAFHGAEVLT
jgi:hypothetical protein